jgi:hypothetical protein
MVPFALSLNKISFHAFPGYLETSKERLMEKVQPGRTMMRKALKLPNSEMKIKFTAKKRF